MFSNHIRVFLVLMCTMSWSLNSSAEQVEIQGESVITTVLTQFFPSEQITSIPLVSSISQYNLINLTMPSGDNLCRLRTNNPNSRAISQTSTGVVFSTAENTDEVLILSSGFSEDNARWVSDTIRLMENFEQVASKQLDNRLLVLFKGPMPESWKRHSTAITKVSCGLN